MHVKCPICRKKTAWEGNPWRPFCSERCKLTDIGKWVDGAYTIPAAEDESARNESGE